MPFFAPLENQAPDSDLSGFARHGLQHTSASQINMYAECPHAWVGQYLFNRRSAFGSAAKSGVLVEEAIVNVLARGFTADAAIAYAVGEFNKFTALGATDADNNRGLAMPQMVYGALEALKPYGTPEFAPDGKQKKVEVVCNGDGWKLPIIGFIDLHYPLHGKIIDIKSTMKMPSAMSDPHKRQACIYQRAMGNQTVDFLYITGKKAQMLSCPDVPETLAGIKSILNRQERLLRLGDKELLRSIVPVITSSYYSDDGITQELFNT